MPKLKQPSSLEAIAMKALVESNVRFCDQLSTEGTLLMLREGILVIKEDVCSRIPWCSLPEFCTTFLENFSQKSRPKRHLEAASEILLDVEFIGLRCNGKLLRHLKPYDVYRLRGLVELDLGSEENLPTILENYHLNDLTTLILPKDCSDHDLAVIGRNCSKLRVIKLECSKITDAGMQALSSCLELRVLDIFGCDQITDFGVELLITSHEKLEELSHGDWIGHRSTQSDGCRFLSRLKRPCPAMKRFCVQTNELTEANLRSIVTMFPNLSHFGTRCKLVRDLSMLKSLSKLEGLSFSFGTTRSDFDDIRAWRSLKDLLTHVGKNIKNFSFYKQGIPGIIHVTDQTSLDFIFRTCPNIEYLEFDHGDYDLVIPPFKKLKILRLKTRCVDRDPYEIRLSNIGEMLNLEVLAIQNFEITFATVKTIVLDYIRFPKLIRIENYSTWRKRELEAIVRNNNLDFEISSDWR